MIIYSYLIILRLIVTMVSVNITEGLCIFLSLEYNVLIGGGSICVGRVSCDNDVGSLGRGIATSLFLLHPDNIMPAIMITDM